MEPVDQMPISEQALQTIAASAAGNSSAPDIAESAELTELLRQAFGCQFVLFDGRTGEMAYAPHEQPPCNWALRAELIREVARRDSPEFIDDEDPFLVLAIPFADARDNPMVAVATFVTRSIELDVDLSSAAAVLVMQADEAAFWASRQTPHNADTLCRIADLAQNQWRSRLRVVELEEEASSLSANLSETYEEISLLYRLTQKLKISASDEELGLIALEWLQEVLPATALAIQLAPLAQEDGSLDHSVRAEPVLLSRGDCPVDNMEFGTLLEYLGSSEANRPLVANRPITKKDDWPCPRVRQMIAVSLAEGENLFGWLAAFNHDEDDEFGTVEASLLSSVAAILGIHSGNIELYRQQSELMAGVVRALTSAIDAKDPYTCGHSDRVARVAVRLAEELGCDAEALNTIYLSGLLHDVGKIGISDSVLRKPGKLTDEEYEHIKTHSDIGHRILRDLVKLDDVLPVVLHHHESWDGGGYPNQLDSERIPLLARIVAVADSFDAMGSDRPYRKGMPDEKIDKIFRSGAGQQWDPEVIDAFFRARDDLRRITAEQQAAIVNLPGSK